jgi:hypothetical protein
MALSEMGLSIGLRRSLQDRERTAEAKKPIPLYTQQEITNMMLTVPQDLTSERLVETPAGTWQIQDGIAVFDPKSKEELDRVTLPDRSLRKRLSKAAEIIFQMK